MADPYRLRSYHAVSEVRSRHSNPTRRVWHRMRFDSHIRETVLVVLGTLLACHLALSLSSPPAADPSRGEHLAGDSQRSTISAEDVYWMTR